MPIPRFIDPDDGVTPVEPVLFCPKCGYALSECKIARDWEECPVPACVEGRLEHRLIRYPAISGKSAVHVR